MPPQILRKDVIKSVHGDIHGGEKPEEEFEETEEEENETKQNMGESGNDVAE